MLVVATELESKRLLADLSILENWFCRGLFYSFLGLMSLDVDTSGVSPPAGTLGLVLQVEMFAATMLVVLGLLYSLMG